MRRLAKPVQAAALALALAWPGYAAAQSNDRIRVNSLAGAFLAARVAETDADFDNAISFYTRALAFDPRNNSLKQNLMVALIASGEFDRALVYAGDLKEVPEVERFSRVALAVDAFRKGEMTTRMIDDWIREEGSPIQPASVEEHYFTVAAIISALNPGGDWFRSSGVGETGIELQRGEERRKVLLRFERGRLVLAKVGDDAIAIDGATSDGSVLALTLQGRTVKYAYHANGGQIAFAMNGEVLVFEERLAPGSAREKSDPLRPVAPVTGLVTRVLVTAGAQVVEGAALAVIEAMKMETTVTAAVAGRVNIVHVVEGNQVSAGAAICEIRREGE